MKSRNHRANHNIPKRSTQDPIIDIISFEGLAKRYTLQYASGYIHVGYFIRINCRRSATVYFNSCRLAIDPRH